MCPRLPIAPRYTRFRFYYQENNFDLNALCILCHLHRETSIVVVKQSNRSFGKSVSVLFKYLFTFIH